MIDAPDLLNALDRESERARQYRPDDDVANAVDFYSGEKYGNEEEGRSQVVTRDVAEVVDQANVNILETMVSGDKVVVFEADTDEPQQDEQGQLVALPDYGEQATEAVHYQFMRKQRPKGYRVLHDVCKSGLLERWGIVKTFAERRFDIETLEVPGSVFRDPEFNPDDYSAIDETDQSSEIDFGSDEDNKIWRLSRKVELPRAIRDVPVPIERFFVSPDASDLDLAPYCGHEEEKSLSDLRSMGFEVDDTLAAALVDSTIKSARDRGNSPSTTITSGAGRMVALREEYIRFDYDGDGITELLCVHRVGQTILNIEEVAEQPFSMWVPFPMPHRLTGDSLADKTMDIQLVNSTLMRLGLDELYKSMRPRTAVEVNSVTEDTYDDLLTPEHGALIRYKGTAPQPWTDAAPSGQAFSAMEFMLAQRDQRTGINRHSQGLNPDSLNKTYGGMAMLQDNSDKMLKYLARNFVEMCVADMFAKRYRLMRQWQQPFAMKIDGKRELIDPSQWPEEIDIDIGVGLGSNRKEQRIQARMTVAGLQEKVIATGSKMVQEKQVFNNIKGLVRDYNLGTATDYFADPETLPPEEPGQPSPEEQKMQADAMKAQQELKFKQWEAEQRFTIEREKMALEDQRERDRMDREFALAAERVLNPDAPAYQPGGALDR